MACSQASGRSLFPAGPAFALTRHLLPTQIAQETASEMYRRTGGRPVRFVSGVCRGSMEMNASSFVLLAAIAGFLVAGCVAPSPLLNVSQLLPGSLAEWQPAGAPREYNADTLYDYIDGAAEVYLRFSFRRVAVQEYQHPELPPITVEVFDMSHPWAAYGMFTFSREGPGVGIGTDSEYVPCVLRFWKGRFLVVIYADHETPGGKAAIWEFGRRIADAIREESPRPALVRCLPPAGLLSASLRYFRDPFCLSYHFPLGGENVFQITADTEAVLATYERDGTRSRLLLVAYPSVARAAAAWESVAAHFQFNPEGFSWVNDRQPWTGGRQVGRYLVAVFQAPSAAAARLLLDEATRNLPATTETTP